MVRPKRVKVHIREGSLVFAYFDPFMSAHIYIEPGVHNAAYAAAYASNTHTHTETHRHQTHMTTNL